MRLSVLIPTLNEARYLGGAVAAVRRRAALGPPEVIVADCDSADGTAALAARLGARVVGPGLGLDSRAAALNAAAAAARGDVLLSLDADTLVPPGYDRAIAGALRDREVVGGAFEFALDGPQLPLRVVELINRVRYRLWPQFYGDQGLFARAEAFRRVGGYPPRRIMESSDLSRVLSRRGRLVLLHKRVQTSPRRFLEGGVWRVLAHDAWVWGRDQLGLATERFGPAYQEDNRRRGAAARG